MYNLLIIENRIAISMKILGAEVVVDVGIVVVVVIATAAVRILIIQLRLLKFHFS